MGGSVERVLFARGGIVDMRELFVINAEIVFLVQLLGVVGVGGFIGEFYRSSLSSSPVSVKLFISSILAGGFLAYIISLAFYYFVYENKTLALIMGSLLSYQDERYISRFVAATLEGRVIRVIAGAIRDLIKDSNNNNSS